MHLKKKFIQILFSNKKSFSIIYSDEKDLKNGVIKLCNYLKKGTFLIQLFSEDRLNQILSIYKNNCLNYNNFNYYKIDNLDFLNNVSFEKLRFYPSQKIQCSQFKITVLPSLLLLAN